MEYTFALYQIMEDEMDWACSTYAGDEKCIQNFSRQNQRKEITSTT